MRKLQCQSCNSVLDWDGTEEIIVCPSCGMRYQMYSKTPKERARAAALKGGCFADRPILSGPDTGKVLYASWLPEGWTYKVGCDSNIFRHGASVSTPFVPFIVLMSSDHKSYITHYTTNGYVDPGPGGMPNGAAVGMGALMGRGPTFLTPAGDVMIVGKTGFMGQESSNDPSSLGVPSYNRWRELVSAADYCDEIAVLNGYLSNLSIMNQQDEMDDVSKARIAEVKKTLPDQVAQTVWWDWCRKLYRGVHDGEEYAMVCEAQIATSGFNVEEAAYKNEVNQGSANTGIFGALMGGFMQPSMPQSSLPRWWQTDYEAVMLCPVERFDEIYAEYLKFIETLELGRDFKSEQDRVGAFIVQEAARAQNTLNDTMMQMAADNMASAQRRSDIIRETNDYTTGVMRDMAASNSASMDRVHNMQSEMIGGYNVYQGTDGNLVRADISFDHVYQGTGTNSDTLIGIEGGWLEPGVDFVPLDRIKGGDY